MSRLKCSKISNTFLFLFSTKMLVIRADIHKLLARIADREEPDQTASFWDCPVCLSLFFWQATSVRNVRTFTVSKSSKKTKK